MGYYFDWENAGGAAAIPLSAKDPLKNARPKSVKWLLYTALTGDFGLESSAEALGLDVDDTEEALQFWRDRGVIKSSESASDREVQRSETTSSERQIENYKKTTSAEPHVLRLSSYDLLRPLDKREVTETIENSPALIFLFNELQRIVPGAPTLTEQRVYILIHEYYGIDVSNIIMMVDFAVSIGKYQNRSPAYIDYLAKEWHKRGIITHKQAIDDILRLREYYTFEGRIAAIFSVGRQFSAKEREIISEWQKYGYYDDIYHFAYEITIEHTGAVKLPYLDKILANWYAKGLRNIEEITAYNEKYLTEHSGYKVIKYDKNESKKPKSKPSFNLENAANEDLEAAMRGELG
ncbi:MAG: DnaD domain protein [Ruminococcus sp.]|jgi:DnaD/phage-associated family protein|nr:DnaD domain protein [Ruminococcus sp.]